MLSSVPSSLSFSIPDHRHYPPYEPPTTAASPRIPPDGPHHLGSACLLLHLLRLPTFQSLGLSTENILGDGLARTNMEIVYIRGMMVITSFTTSLGNYPPERARALLPCADKQRTGLFAAFHHHIHPLITASQRRVEGLLRRWTCYSRRNLLIMRIGQRKAEHVGAEEEQRMWGWLSAKFGRANFQTLDDFSGPAGELRAHTGPAQPLSVIFSGLPGSSDGNFAVTGSVPFKVIVLNTYQFRQGRDVRSTPSVHLYTTLERGRGLLKKMPEHL